MAFLDNSGDIILDVVLTDEGRKRLAQGDGSFKIDKFALGDDEINYSLYNTTASSGQEDLQILQTPVLEAFTNNMSSMKSTLLSYPRNDLFHLPILKLNESIDPIHQRYSNPSVFMVASDANTEDNSATLATATSVALDATGKHEIGFLKGANPSNGGTIIRIDAGIDNSIQSPSTPIADPTLYESSYEIKIDNRLGRIVSKTGAMIQPVSTDDDYVSTYVVGGPGQRISGFVSENADISGAGSQVIAGSRSTILEFKIATSQNLRSSSYMFDLIGSTASMSSPDGNQTVKIIDSIVRITGQLTGYAVDIPVRFVKN